MSDLRREKLTEALVGSNHSTYLRSAVYKMWVDTTVLAIAELSDSIALAAAVDMVQDLQKVREAERAAFPPILVANGSVLSGAIWSAINDPDNADKTCKQLREEVCAKLGIDESTVRSMLDIPIVMDPSVPPGKIRVFPPKPTPDPNQPGVGG